MALARLHCFVPWLITRSRASLKTARSFMWSKRSARLFMLLHILQQPPACCDYCGVLSWCWVYHLAAGFIDRFCNRDMGLMHKQRSTVSAKAFSLDQLGMLFCITAGVQTASVTVLLRCAVKANSGAVIYACDSLFGALLGSAATRQPMLLYSYNIDMPPARHSLRHAVSVLFLCLSSRSTSSLASHQQTAWLRTGSNCKCCSPMSSA